MGAVEGERILVHVFLEVQCVGSADLTQKFFGCQKCRPNTFSIENAMNSAEPHHTPEDEREWVQASLDGDLEAFGKIVLRYQRSVRACLSARLTSPDQADDLAQETFLVAHRRLSGFRPGDALGPWLRTIALNLLRNFQRKFRPEPVGAQRELEALLEGRMENMCQALREDHRAEALRECLREMDGEGRALVEARYVEGLSIQELTSKHGTGHSALTMKLYRLRAALAACVHGRLEAGRAY
jgi:RNA polymerase sigma-70 factor (ECF subfamily)